MTDLQDDVAIDGLAISGTLRYVTGYTGFSGDASEQEGNYLVLHAEATEGAEITAQLVGGQHGAVTLDPDGLIVIRVTDPATQTVKFKAKKNGWDTVQKIYSLTGLTLEEAPADADE